MPGYHRTDLKPSMGTPVPAAQQPFSPRRAAHRQRKRHTWRNALLLVAGLIVVLIVCVLVYVGSIGAAFNDRRQTVDAGLAAQDGDGMLNILLLGSDSRGEGRDTAEVKGEDGARSDTMMLVHVPQDRQDIYVMSIVRDLWVEIPGHGERKINGALGLGGYPLVAQTVEDLVGMEIDHLAVIDFEGFNGLTDALGGVELCNPHAFSSGVINPSFFPAGDILLDGTDALRYVRERKAFLAGDFERVQNQQRFVSAVAGRLLTVETLANPQRIMDVVNGFTPFITVDERLDAATIAGHAWSMRNIRPGDIEMFTVPHGPPATTAGGASIVEQDPAGMAELQRALRSGSMEEFLQGDAEGGSSEDETAEEGQPDDGASSPSPSATASGGGQGDEDGVGDGVDQDGTASAEPTESAAATPQADPTPAPVCAGG